MRELHDRCEGTFTKTAAIVAMIHNVNCSREDQKPPVHFNPFSRQPKERTFDNATAKAARIADAFGISRPSLKDL